MLTCVKCLTLASLLGQGRVAFPDTTPYESSQESYFARQNTELEPFCVVSPESTEEVSSIITSLVATASVLPEHEQAGCNFAIRSGGHNSFGGASNIHQGVTIDLRALKDIRMESPSETDDTGHLHTVFVGAGATWGEVYAHLDPAGLSVAGGRAAQVGVGGLTLGGGISYFSPRYGWTCDSVVGAEIVLANGSIVHLEETQHPEMLAALRGGGSNFGIVTNFDLRAFPQGPIFGGHVYHETETIDAQLRAFSELSDPSAGRYDEYASLITSFGFAGGQGAAVVNSMVYTGELKDGQDRPPVYDSFFEIPQLFSTVRVAPLHEVATEQGSFSQNGKR